MSSKKISELDSIAGGLSTDDLLVVVNAANSAAYKTTIAAVLGMYELPDFSDFAADTVTTTGNITVGGDLSVTGSITNSALTAALAAKANLSGATFTGAVSGTSATFSSTLQASSLYSTGGIGASSFTGIQSKVYFNSSLDGKIACKKWSNDATLFDYGETTGGTLTIAGNLGVSGNTILGSSCSVSGYYRINGADALVNAFPTLAINSGATWSTVAITGATTVTPGNNIGVVVDQSAASMTTPGAKPVYKAIRSTSYLQPYMMFVDHGGTQRGAIYSGSGGILHIGSDGDTPWCQFASTGVVTPLTLTVGSGLTASASAYITGETRMNSSGLLGFTAGSAGAALDTAFYRNAAGVIEINNGTPGTFRDLKARAFTFQYGASSSDFVALSTLGTLSGANNTGGFRYQLVASASGSNEGLRLASDTIVGWNSTTTLGSGSIDTTLTRSSAGVVATSGLRVATITTPGGTLTQTAGTYIFLQAPDIQVAGVMTPNGAAHNIGQTGIRWGTAFVTNVDASTQVNTPILNLNGTGGGYLTTLTYASTAHLMLGDTSNASSNLNVLAPGVLRFVARWGSGSSFDSYGIINPQNSIVDLGSGVAVRWGTTANTTTSFTIDARLRRSGTKTLAVDDGAAGDATFDVTGKVKAKTLNLSNLPTSSSGLSSGDVWNNSGVLTIV